MRFWRFHQREHESMKSKWTAGWIVVGSSRLLRTFYLSFLTCWTALTEIWNTSPADMWPLNLYTQRNIEIFLCVFLIGTKDGGIDQFLMFCKRGGSQSYVPFLLHSYSNGLHKMKNRRFQYLSDNDISHLSHPINRCVLYLLVFSEIHALKQNTNNSWKLIYKSNEVTSLYNVRVQVESPVDHRQVASHQHGRAEERYFMKNIWRTQCFKKYSKSYLSRSSSKKDGIWILILSIL